MQQLKFKDIPVVRERIAAEQEGNCGLCGLPLGDDKALDHSHVTGEVRSTLHRQCNMIIGKIENSERWFRNKEQYKLACERASAYVTRASWTGLEHPGKKIGKKKKRKTKKKKKKDTHERKES